MKAIFLIALMCALCVFSEGNASSYLMLLKQCHHLMICLCLQCLLKRKPLLLKAPTDVVEDVDAAAVVTATMTTATTATTIIMTTAMTAMVDVTVDAIKSLHGQVVVR